METLYTKNGWPLQRRGDDLFSRSGTHVGRFSEDKVYGPDGRYVGRLIGERVIYRSTDSASVSSPFVPKGSKRISYRARNRLRGLGRRTAIRGLDRPAGACVDLPLRLASDRLDVRWLG